MINLAEESTNPKKGIEKKFAEEETIRLKADLYKLQNLFYAEGKHSLLIILQGTDGAGKDGTIRHVFSSVDPQGCNVKSFKAPTDEEQAHDFLWRVHLHAPAKGMIEIFNRSHYEDILVPAVLRTIDNNLIERRYDTINSFERNLTDNGTIILKFFLHLSKEEQKIRMKERLTNQHKKWKYNPADLKEEKHFNAYMKVYEQIIERCSPEIPWHIIPADHKWYRNYAIAKKIVATLKALKMKYPSMQE